MITKNTFLRPISPGIWQLFRTWAKIGLQSFGGGASTIFLIQHECIDRYHWIDAEEFAHLWSLCLMTPGINIIGLTVLIGRKLRGAWGITAAVAGLLLPSALITCLLTAGFQFVQHLPVVQAMLRGVIPATGGIMFLVGLRFAQPLLKQGYTEGMLRLIISIVLIVTVAFLLIVLGIAVPFVLIGAALAGTACFTLISSQANTQTQQIQEPESQKEEIPRD